MVNPSRRKELVQKAVQRDGISIKLVCTTFGISETCYPCEANLSGENQKIADWLLRLTTTYKR